MGKHNFSEFQVTCVWACGRTAILNDLVSYDMISPMYLSTWLAILSPESTLSDSYCSFFKIRSDSYQAQFCQKIDLKEIEAF